MRIPTGYKLVLDISHYQKIDYKVVAPQIDGVIVRVGFGTSPDPYFVQHYEGFMAEGKPVAAYQWFRPDQDVKAQIELVKTMTEGCEINVVFSDQEQRGHWFGIDSPPYYLAAALSTLGQSHISGLATHGFQMGIYSRATWISQYAKPIMDWMYDWITWLASWPFGSGAVTTTWENLKNYWAPSVFSPFFTTDWPTDKRRADAWQWSGDKFILPGITTQDGKPRAVDLNYVSDALLAKFTKPADTTTPTTPDPHLALLENLYNELNDLKSSMSAAQIDTSARLGKDIQELAFIMGLIKPGG